MYSYSFSWARRGAKAHADLIEFRQRSLDMHPIERGISLSSYEAGGALGINRCRVNLKQNEVFVSKCDQSGDLVVINPHCQCLNCCKKWDQAFAQPFDFSRFNFLSVVLQVASNYACTCQYGAQKNELRYRRLLGVPLSLTAVCHSGMQGSPDQSKNGCDRANCLNPRCPIGSIPVVPDSSLDKGGGGDERKQHVPPPSGYFQAADYCHSGILA